MVVIADAPSFITLSYQAYKLCNFTLDLQDSLLAMHVVGDHA